MSSIASPTTTTHRAAIFVNSCSRWSRVSRGSGVGMVIGGPRVAGPAKHCADAHTDAMGTRQHAFQMKAIGQRQGPDPFGSSRARPVPRIVNEVHAAVSGDPQGAVLARFPHRRAHGAADHAG